MMSFQGITVKLDEKDDLVIARILQGSLIDKQGRQLCDYSLPGFEANESHKIKYIRELKRKTKKKVIDLDVKNHGNNGAV